MNRPPSRGPSPPPTGAASSGGPMIRLECFEVVVAGGVRRVSWQLQHEGRWVAAAKYPGASVEMADSQRGTVWRQNVFVRLPVGTHILRFEARPPTPRRGDPMNFLLGQSREDRPKLSRTLFAVSATGGLLRVDGRSAREG